VYVHGVADDAELYVGAALRIRGWCGWLLGIAIPGDRGVRIALQGRGWGRVEVRRSAGLPASADRDFIYGEWREFRKFGAMPAVLYAWCSKCGAEHPIRRDELIEPLLAVKRKHHFITFRLRP
jgi:hypothetical protein